MLYATLFSSSVVPIAIGMIDSERREESYSAQGRLRAGVSCNVALRRILTYTDDSSEEEYGCVSILSFLKTFGYVPGGRLHLLRHRTS